MFTGQCAVHRGQIMRLRGAYAEAVVEFDRAVLRYLEISTPVAGGLALGERGDVLRMRGDLGGAEAAYAAGHAVRLRSPARTGPALAGAGPHHGRRRARCNRLLAEPGLRCYSPRLLPAAVEILLAAGLVDDGGAAGRPAGPVRPAARHAGGPRPWPATRRQWSAWPGATAEAALPRLRAALADFTAIGAAYEVARCRALPARRTRQLGDMASADRGAGRGRPRLRPARGAAGVPGGRSAAAAEAHPADSPRARSRC